MSRFALWKLTLVSKYCRGAVSKKLFESIKDLLNPLLGIEGEGEYANEL